MSSKTILSSALCFVFILGFSAALTCAKKPLQKEMVKEKKSEEKPLEME